MAERAPHYVGQNKVWRNRHGRAETRTARIAVRIEPSLLEAVAEAARRQDAVQGGLNGQRGLTSAWVRQALIDRLPAEYHARPRRRQSG